MQKINDDLKNELNEIKKYIGMEGGIMSDSEIINISENGIIFNIEGVTSGLNCYFVSLYEGVLEKCDKDYGDDLASVYIYSVSGNSTFLLFLPYGQCVQNGTIKTKKKYDFLAFANIGSYWNINKVFSNIEFKENLFVIYEGDESCKKLQIIISYQKIAEVFTGGSKPSLFIIDAKKKKDLLTLVEEHLI